MPNRIPRRVVATTAAGSLALALCVGLAPSASAEPRWFTDAMYDAMQATSDAAQREGVSAVFSNDDSFKGGVRTLVVDPVTSTSRYTEPLWQEFTRGRLPFETGQDPCNPGDQASRADRHHAEVTIRVGGVGHYRSLTSSTRTRFVRRGLRLVGEPGARWDLRRGGHVSRLMRLDGGALGDAARLYDLMRPEINGTVSEEDGPDGGRRFVYTDRRKAERIDVDLEHHATVDVAADGRILRVVHEKRSQVPGGVALTNHAESVFTYGPQRVAVPAADTVVSARDLNKGCRAALLRETVRTYPRLVARKLNSRHRTPSVRDLRRVVRYRLDHLHVRLRLKAVRERDGLTLVGRHPLLGGKVSRRLAVEDGRVVMGRFVHPPKPRPASGRRS